MKTIKSQLRFGKVWIKKKVSAKIIYKQTEEENVCRYISQIGKIKQGDQVCR